MRRHHLEQIASVLLLLAVLSIAVPLGVRKARLQYNGASQLDDIQARVKAIDAKLDRLTPAS